MIPGFALHPHPALHHLQLVTARKKRGCAYSDKLGRNTGFKLKMKTLPQGRAHKRLVAERSLGSGFTSARARARQARQVENLNRLIEQFFLTELATNPVPARNQPARHLLYKYMLSISLSENTTEVILTMFSTALSRGLRV